MVSRDKPIKKQVREYLDSERPAAITEAVWKDLLWKLAPVSDTYLRELLHATGLPFEQPWAGIRQHTFDQLEQSLREVSAIYVRSVAAQDGELSRYCRRQVLAAKDRARFLARNPHTPPDKQADKEEMAAWMLVWLENPDVFPAWLDARKRAIQLRLPPETK